jgi:HEAT repeat protein
MELLPEQMTAFVAAIDQPEERAQREAVEWLGIIPGAVRVRQLIPLLRHPSRHVRGYVIRRLEEHELRGETYPDIEAALEDESAEVRVHAAMILQHAPKLRQGPDAARLLGILTAALRDSGYYTRVQAARALIRLGASARPFLPLLFGLAGDEHENVRVQAVRAAFLAGATPEEAEPVLRRLASDPSPFVRSYVQTARERLGLGVAGSAESSTAADPARDMASPDS